MRLFSGGHQYQSHSRTWACGCGGPYDFEVGNEGHRPGGGQGPEYCLHTQGPVKKCAFGGRNAFVDRDKECGGD